MKVIGLISGGKDSCYNLMECIRLGHEIVALANLMPPKSSSSDEIDSFMYQTVGHQAISQYAEAIGVPLYRREIIGSAVVQSMEYNAQQNITQTTKEIDEVESLFELLREVKV